MRGKHRRWITILALAGGLLAVLAAQGCSTARVGPLQRSALRAGRAHPQPAQAPDWSSVAALSAARAAPGPEQSDGARFSLAAGDRLGVATVVYEGVLGRR